MDSKDIKTFIAESKEILSTGVASELSYRSAFESLFKKGTDVFPINDPKAADHNKPDFKFVLNSNKELIVGYAEMKDLDKNLDVYENSKQLERYKTYQNLFLTNGLDWRFFRDGVKYYQVEIATFDSSCNKLKIYKDHFESLANQLNFFFQNSYEPITSGKKLAEIMGNHARIIRDNILKNVVDGEIQSESINGLYHMFKMLLVSDLTVESFADMYAQTLVYGLFIARFNDTTPENFSRSEACELIPSTNPLLRDFFDHIAGVKFDGSLKPIVDNLCQIFCVSDIKNVVSRHVNLNEEDYRDPIIHFYEDFLDCYDSKLKKDMGAYYTPTPVVKYIIKMVDSVLKEDFKITDGIADSKTTTITKQTDEGFTISKRKDAKVHFEEKITIPEVQILDPAVGTATFLNETIRYIYKQKFINQQGMWDDYVNKNLIPRLNGFEIMMTPYTIAHLKLGMTLQALGATVRPKNRLRVFLTNTLTEGIKGDLPLLQLFGLATAVTKESEMAAEVKNDYPVMVVMGNPPYSVSSSNNSEYINNLVNDYKAGLDEQNKQPLSDDYIKFIRFAESMIEKTGKGVVAMITNNSYLNGVIHRTMRKHLLDTFDKIYILNLHGNYRRKETAPDGSKDENVFDIMPGVAIVVMVKSQINTKKDADIFYSDIYGDRSSKFAKLNEGVSSTNYQKIECKGPFYFFVPMDYSELERYQQGVKVTEIFNLNKSGVKTHDDSNLISFDPFDSATDKLTLYRPFDVRHIDYDLDRVVRPRYDTMKHMDRSNIALLTCRQQSTYDFQHALVTQYYSDICTVSSQTSEGCNHFPLYTYDDAGNKIVNLNQNAVKKLTVNIGDQTPEDIFDYIYAKLYSPSYRKQFNELLKIDFPSIPIPTKEEFERLVPLGKLLRETHLMNKKLVTQVHFNVPGDNVITGVVREDNKVYINKTQYFDNVSDTAWEFYIGGYQPAQKWLKDRKNRTLTFQDVEQYEQIIAIMEETKRIMELIG